MGTISTALQETKTRQAWVDTARGFAILCVIAGHMAVGISRQLIFAFHMPFFFLLAGWFQKKESAAAFVKKRARQLLLPYLLTGLALIIFTQLNNAAKTALRLEDAQPPLYLLKEWVKAILLGSGSRTDFLGIHSDIIVGAVWFLLALFFAQLLVNVFIRRERWKPGIALIALIAAAGFVSAKFFWLPLSVQAGAAASVYVLAGYLLRNAHGITLSRIVDSRKIVLTSSAIGLAYCALLLATGKTLGLVSANYPYWPLDYVGSTAVCVCVLFVSYRVLDKIPLVNTLLRFLGRNSLIVLCAHLVEMDTIPIQGVVSYGLSLLGVGGAQWLVLTLTFVCKVVWAALAVLLVNSIRRRLSRRASAR